MTDYKLQRDSLITDVANLRNQRDKLQRELDEVVSMVNTYITATKAYSGDGAYNLLGNELNRILEGRVNGTNSRTAHSNVGNVEQGER